MTLNAPSRPAPLRDPRLRKVAEAVRATQPELVTFDVFDTLVFRKVDLPVDVFAYVGRRLRKDGLLRSDLTPAMFGAMRAEAEKRARALRAEVDGSWEIDLHGIYDAFPSWPLTEEATAERLVAIEVEVERGFLVPDLEVVAFLEQLKAEGQPLAAVSDTYFRSETLRELLRLPRLIALLEGVPIHVSCELGFGKGSGLWHRTQEVLETAPGQIVHFGDNVLDDVVKAREAGVVAVAFPQRDDDLAAVKERERALADTAVRPLPLEARDTEHPAGLRGMRGKVAALAEGDVGGREEYWRYGATVLGPVLSGFAQWVAREAAHAGMSRVGCLMREGTLLAELITAAAAAEGVVIEAIPTWLNRHVGLAATLSTHPEGLERLLAGRTTLTVAQGLSLLGVPREDVPELAGHAATRLHDPTVRRMFEEAIGNPARREKAAAHGRELASRAARLLERSADPSGRLWLVDLGWGASIQADAVEILERQGSPLEVAGLYLLTNQSAVPRAAAGLDVRSFLLDAGSPSALVDMFMRSPEVIEQVTCAAVGTQRGIDAELRPVTAVLDPSTDGQRLDAGAVRDGIRAFHASWLTYRTVVPSCLPTLADAQAELVPILLRSVVAPTAHEARLFGEWRHDEGRGSAAEDTLGGADHEHLASHASADQLQALSMQELYWPAALVARYEPDAAPLLQAAASGLVPWKALSTVVGTARYSAQDAASPEAPPQAENVELRSTFKGNVLLRWSASGADLQELTIEVCRDPHVVRFDRLELRLWEQGAADARVVRLAASDLVLQVPRERYATVGHNVLVARSSHAALQIDLHALRAGVVSRVEVAGCCGLMVLPAPLGGRLELDTEENRRLNEVVEDMKGSMSWRVTKPLRRAAAARRQLR